MNTMERIRWELPRSNRHPAAAGGLMLELEVADGRVCRADPIPGREHRGAEKLFESRDYRSLLALANRHDWLGSFTSELGLAQLLEAFLGIEVPEQLPPFVAGSEPRYRGLPPTASYVCRFAAGPYRSGF